MSMFGQIMLLVPRSALAMPLRHCILVESVLLFFFFFVFHVYAQKFLSIVWFLKTTLLFL